MKFILVILIIYVAICVVLYFIQEHLIFFPDKTEKNFHFSFNQPAEELFIQTKDQVSLNGVLFTSTDSKGLVFYLHGNAGSIESWGEIAPIFTDLHYDLFIPDYRGYGKSQGKITNEQQLHDDVQLAFDQLKERYVNKNIIIIGYSLGTALAARLASVNKVNMLILQAPYYSFTDLMNRHYKIIPPIVLRYKLETYKYVQDCRMPIVIFHGDRDEVIDYRSSLKLRPYLKPTDKLITLKGVGHNGMSHDPQYQAELKKILY